MSKIEKTLELNITNELIALADSFWGYLSTVSLHIYWRPAWRFPFLPYPKSYATGLPITLEGRAGGGYDVCLVTPGVGGRPDRAVFMQFKAGAHEDFNPNPQSIFFGSASSPKPHVSFTFNNNKKKDQHKLLQDLEKAKAGLGHPVLYCFPRITTEQQVRDNAGKLLHKTSFISVSDLDAQAALAGVAIQVGKVHNFRTDYNDYTKSEVNFFFHKYDGPDQSANFIAEIVAVRVMRALDALKEYSHLLPKIYMTGIARAFVQYLRHLSNYFGLSFYQEIPQIIQTVPSQKIKRILLRMLEGENFEELQADSPNRERHREIFYAIVSELSPYFKLLEKTTFNQVEAIPEASSNFTFQITSNGLRLGLQDNVEPQDFDDITYSIF